MARNDTYGRQGKTNKGMRFSSFDALAAYAMGADPEPRSQAAPSEAPDPDRMISEFQARSAEREASRASSFYDRYEKARDKAASEKAVAENAAKKAAEARGPGLSGKPAGQQRGPGLLLKDVRTDSLMAEFDAFEKRKAERGARKAARAYAAIPGEFHRKGFRSDGRFVKREGWEEKVHTVRTRCSCCGREFEFSTTQLSSWRNVRAFCSDKCRYDWCYGRKGREMRKEASDERTA